MVRITNLLNQEQSDSFIPYLESAHNRSLFGARLGLSTLPLDRRLPHPALQPFHRIHPHIPKTGRSKESYWRVRYLPDSALSHPESKAVRRNGESREGVYACNEGSRDCYAV